MTSKTAAAVLQELMVQLREIPEYECINKSGPPHMSVFLYRCKAHGITMTAEAHSKKDAKQEVARLMLLELSKLGLNVPPPFAATPLFPSSSVPRPPSPTAASSASRSAVSLLKELCDQYHLPSVEYELIGDSGPPHMRHFTIKAKVGPNIRTATSTTKKAARQLAADQLYTYLRENLARITKDFDEEDALMRAHEKAMDRYDEIKDEQAWRPDLGQKISDYHLGLIHHTDEAKQTVALQALDALKNCPNEEALNTVVSILGLEMEYAELDLTEGNDVTEKLIVLQLPHTCPTLAFVGASRDIVALETLDYMRLALRPLKSSCETDDLIDF